MVQMVTFHFELNRILGHLLSELSNWIKEFSPFSKVTISKYLLSNFSFNSFVAPCLWFCVVGKLLYSSIVAEYKNFNNSQESRPLLS